MKRTDITAQFPDASKDQIDALLNINGADIENARAGLTDLQTQLQTAQTRLTELEQRPTADALQAAQQSAAALQTELDALKAANALRDMRASVAKDTGVPAELLTGDTDEACRAQAQSILDFAKPGAYPTVRDGGEPGGHPSGETRDQFKDWYEQNFNKGE